jgi:hypothetical protein
MLYVLRINDKHEKGYVVDLGITKGPTLQGLDLVMDLAEKLCQQIG